MSREEIENLKRKIERSEESTEPDIRCPAGNPNCNGYGNENVPGNGFRPCKCARDKQMQGKLGGLLNKVQEKHRSAILEPDTLEETESLAAGKDFLAGISREGSIYVAKKSLLLCGAPDSGKTAACIYVAGQLIRSYPDINLAFWLNFQDLVDQVILGGGPREGGDLAESRRYVRRMIQNSDVVIVDEFGRAGLYKDERLDQAVDQLAYEVANVAVEGRKPALIATNLKVKDFLEHPSFQEATRSRLADSTWRRIQVRPIDRRKM
ncbi:MAG TPA: ATP-binding protein [bacterium]|nr:ATP-binding protein [bacterium]HQL63622.1 ATP-binding protein [bacterium]